MAMQLATVEQIKGYLAIGSVADDALLARMLDAASGFIQTWINRSLELQSYSALLDGNGSDTLVLRNFPIVSVAELRINGAVIAAAASDSAIGYWHDDSRLVLRGLVFPRGRGNVRVSYQAGFASPPADLTQACIEMVSLRYREKDRVGLVSKGLAGETTAYSLKDMPESVRTLLNRYRRVVPA
jgi:uncharacterized phiE125 gp8 family phage protein